MVPRTALADAALVFTCVSDSMAKTAAEDAEQ
jgi:hypothetical protein